MIPVGLSGLKALREGRPDVVKKKEKAAKGFAKLGDGTWNEKRDVTETRPKFGIEKNKKELQQACDELNAYDRNYEDCLRDPTTWKKSLVDDLKGLGSSVKVNN